MAGLELPPVLLDQSWFLGVRYRRPSTPLWTGQFNFRAKTAATKKYRDSGVPPKVNGRKTASSLTCTIQATRQPQEQEGGTV